ncbi:MAG: ABC transporter permease [Candidatus Wallbacteria bacterium GWC2_49_35]|uniref:ABC transporter permease n=1 Tax=Candidatus Wallbacteria bacterium GWC2_49_35 TaxID=1817813 RepID=A0A1F7X1W1_9BACT|nr:MAG: ABC transporter permease [Candidatus Wallbacteria bacterium GWC2_49_35]HBC73847.1 ABC transporter permease [Candidatus Wallbacteria bacterium]
MPLLLGTFTIGFILSILAIGALISFRIFNFADITSEGSLALGASAAAVLIAARSFDPFTVLLIASAAGAAAGAVTGVLHTKFKINALLAGILVMTALYSVNLHVMGKSNVALMNEETVFTFFNKCLSISETANKTVSVFGWPAGAKDLSGAALSFILALVCGTALFWFLRTELGSAMRATGDNPQMASALGVNTDLMVIAGLALSNALAALSGALLASYQGFADVQIGIGMLVWGLASVIIGETLVREKSIGLAITSAVMGSVFFRLLVAIALRFGMNPNDMKLITALFVLMALILPSLGRGGKFFKKKADPKEDAAATKPSEIV